MTAPTFWVTGAYGFIGRYLATELAQQGNLVAGIGHGHWPAFDAERWGVSHWNNGSIDAVNLDGLAELSGMPAGIFHLAGGSAVGPSLQAPLEDFNRTVASGAAVFDWVRRRCADVPVLVVSSAAVHGAGHEASIAAGSPLNPYSPYGHHKLMLEQLAQAYAGSFDLRSSIVRLFSVYGAGLRKQLLWDLCSRLQSGVQHLELGGTGEELRDWTEVTDVVRLLADAIAYSDVSVPVFNGGTGVGTSVSDVARLLCAAWSPDVTYGFSGIRRAGDPFRLVSVPCEIDGKAFDWKVDVETGIARYVDWFRREHV